MSGARQAAARSPRGEWTLSGARRYFAQPASPVSVSIVGERADEQLRWCDVTFAAVSIAVPATVVLPVSDPVTHGVVIAHGGSDDGRERLVAEAAALAASGAAVVLPVTRIRLGSGVDAFASDVRGAVLTGRAALDLLSAHGAPPHALSFLGHSAGGALAAIMSAVEPRLAKVVIFGNGAGPVARSELAGQLARGGPVTAELATVAGWFDLANFVRVDRRADLLVQHGRHDRSVPVEAARALFDAAADPKRWIDYDCDHALDADPEARHDRAEFVTSAN